MDAAKLQAWWAHRQGLDSGSFREVSPAAVLAQAGWARSVGGAAPYLTLFSRAHLRRNATDKAIAALEIHELPSARSCTYVLPAADFGLGLALARAAGDSDLRLALKLGSSEVEIETLASSLLEALQAGPLDPEGLKSVLGPAVRNYGEAGRKKGLSTSLPVALAMLQNAGKIRRIPVDGRLDQQRYRYQLWTRILPSPPSAEDAFRELAERYYRWIGPAKLTEYQWFSGLSGKAAKAATAALELEDIGGGFLLHPGDRAAFSAFKIPKSPSYSLVANIDSMILLRRNHVSLTRGAEIPGIGGVADLPSHAILDRGAIVGLWEYDPAAGSIVWSTFGSGHGGKQLEDAVAQVAEFISQDLGDFRSFSLDSAKSRIPRIEALRADRWAQ